MVFARAHIAVILSALFVGSCSFVDDALYPSLSPDGSGTWSSTGNSSSSSVAASGAVESSAISFQLPNSSSGYSSGTFVGQKVAALRNDLSQLQATLTAQNTTLQQIRNQVAQDSARYNGTVAAISTRLQLGTTPGNPVLVQQWNEAQNELDRLGTGVLQMNRLASDVAATSGMTAYLLESVRAARSLAGAVDEDHRQLRILEDDTSATTVIIERLLNDISTDAQRQQQYVNAQRVEMNALAVAIKSGQYYGSSLSVARANAVQAGHSSFSGSTLPSDRPLVVIRFDRANVSYEDALYTAVKGALERRPNAVFEVYAVSSASGSTAVLGETTARRNADAVVRSLTQMGLPSERIRLSSATSNSASNGEVRVYVR